MTASNGVEKPPQTRGNRDERQERLAAALRENLHRRKAQSRARLAAVQAAPETADEDGNVPRA